MIKVRYFFQAVVFFHSLVYCQVNTEAMRSENTEEMNHLISLSYDLEQSDSKVEDISVDYRVDFSPFDNSTAFLSSSFERGLVEENGNKDVNVNKGFMHFRITSRFTDNMFAEAFEQIEFNDFLDIEKRVLHGAGARFKIQDLIINPVFIGLGLMNETEDYTIEGEEDKDLIRSTSYLKVVFEITENISCSNTAYFQFDLKDFDDHRVLLDSSLNFDVNESISLGIDLNYRFDNSPHGELGNEYYQLSNKISMNF